MDERNDFDELGRYQAKRDPLRFFPWLLHPDEDLTFVRWGDARRVGKSRQAQRTNDLVAELHDAAGETRILLVEPMTRSQPHAVERMLEYVVLFRGEPKQAGSAWPVGAVVINFTGPRRRATVTVEVLPDVRLQFSIRQRTLRDESAGDLMTAIENGRFTPWLLPWIPLMRGGNEPAIIERWKAATVRKAGAGDRDTLASMVCIYAELKGRRVLWEQALKEFKLKRSQLMEEFAEGALDALRRMLLRQGEGRFGRSPSAVRRLQGIADSKRLERMVERILEVGSWKELLETP